MTIPHKYHIPLLLLVCLCIFFPHLGVMYENIMEARNFVTARDMVERGNWIFTTINDTPRYQKPPMPTWFTALSALVFGLGKLWALRLPAAIMATLLTLSSYRLGREIFKDAMQALYAALILATSFYIVFAGRNGTWDIYCHAFTMVSIYCLWHFIRGRKLLLNAIGAGVFIGFSFLSKGPVSHYALLLPFIIAYLVVYRPPFSWKKAFPLSLLIICALVVGLSWGLVIYFFDHDTLTRILEAEAAARGNRNVRPFYYYWSFFTQSGIWTIPAFIGLLYPYLKNKVKDLQAYRFTLFWTLAAVILLSIIPDKKSRYLMPMLIPLALNTSFYIKYLVHNFQDFKSNLERFPVYFNFGIIAVIALVAGITGVFALDLTGLWPWFVLLALSLIIVGVVIVRGLRAKNISRVFMAVIAFTCCVIVFGFPLMRITYSNPDFDRLSPKITQWQAQGVPVYMFDNGSPELLWDTGHVLPVVVEDGVHLPQEDEFMVILDGARIDDFTSEFASFDFQEVDVIDGNVLPGTDRNHKDRRVAHVFKVSQGR